MYLIPMWFSKLLKLYKANDESLELCQQYQ